MRAMAEAIALSMPCPVDMAALTILVAAAAAIGNARQLRVKSSWYKRPRLWVATVSTPGSKKTTALFPAIGERILSACWELLLPGSAGSSRGSLAKLRRGMATTTSLGIAAVLLSSKICLKDGGGSTVSDRGTAPQGREEQNPTRNNYFGQVWLTPLPPPLPHTMSALFPL
jgi:hypothetical protein